MIKEEYSLWLFLGKKLGIYTLGRVFISKISNNLKAVSLKKKRYVLYYISFSNTYMCARIFLIIAKIIFLGTHNINFLWKNIFFFYHKPYCVRKQRLRRAKNLAKSK